MKLAIFGLGTTELLIIVAIVVLVLGASRLPSLGKGLGLGLRGFRDALRGDGEHLADDEKKNDDKTNTSTRGSGRGGHPAG